MTLLQRFPFALQEKCNSGQPKYIVLCCTIPSTAETAYILYAKHFSEWVSKGHAPAYVLGVWQTQRKGIMAPSEFDILERHDDGSFVWVESTQDLPAAQARLLALSIESPGEYFVFDKKTQQFVVSRSTRPTN